MPIAKVRLEDGRIARFEVPEGTSPEQVMSFAKNQSLETPKQQNEGSFLSNLMGGLGYSAVDPMTGLAQLGLSGAESIAEKAGYPETAASLAGGKKYLETDINFPSEQERMIRESGGGKVGHMIGDVLQLAGPSGYAAGAANVASKIPSISKAATKLSPYLGDAAATFGLTYLQPEKEGESRGSDALVNSLLSVAGRGGAEKLGQFAAAAKAPSIQMAEKLGIPVGIASMTENPFVRYLATQANNLSLTNPRGRAQKGFNRAVSRTFGEDTSELTPAILSGAQDRIGAEMDRLYGKGISDTTELQSKMAELLRRSKENLVPSQYSSLEGTVGDITGLIKNNAISPKAAENLSKTIRGRVNEAYKGSDSVLAGSLKEPKNILEESLQKELGEKAGKELLDARDKYRALKMVEHLATINSGNVTPQRLLTKIASETGDKIQNAGEIGQIAELGAKYLKNTVPDSGTPTRSLLIEAMKNHPLSAAAGGAVAGGFAPLTTAGVIGGSTLLSEALYSPTARKMLGYMASKAKESKPQYLLPAFNISTGGD